MRLNFLSVLYLALFTGLGGYAVWAWVAWIKSNKEVVPAWRASVLWFGICCTTISTGLSEFLYIHAQITGGYPFHDNFEMNSIFFGGLLSLFGIACSIAGKGKVSVRVALAIISVVNLVLWVGDGISQ